LALLPFRQHYRFLPQGSEVSVLSAGGASGEVGRQS
jgi:hypothetical protein